MQSEQSSNDEQVTIAEAVSAILEAIGQLEKRIQTIEANQAVLAEAIRRLGLVAEGHQKIIEAASDTPRKVSRAASKALYN